MLSHFRHIQLFGTLCTAACQAPLTIGFSMQEYWSGLLCPSSGDLPDPGIEPTSPALADGFFTTSASWEAPFPCGRSLIISYAGLPSVHSLSITGECVRRNWACVAQLLSWKLTSPQKSCALGCLCVPKICTGVGHWIAGGEGGNCCPKLPTLRAGGVANRYECYGLSIYV